MKQLRKFVFVFVALSALSLIAAACGESVDSAATDADFIVVDEGEQIQIRSLNAITGDISFLGIPNQRGVEAAVADYGNIQGFEVTSGAGLDDLCSADGGQAAAQTIVADEQIVGVIGPSCSGAATAAAPLISQAGIVMISPSNTSPALTSDLKGTPGENYNEGYYRTAPNDLHQGNAVARFVFEELGLKSAAAVHDGDPYTQGVARAFADAFELLGGTLTGFTAVNKEDTDMVPVLTEMAAGSPDALFFPIFQPAGDFIADQAHGVAGLENTQLLAGAALLVDGFLELTQSEGIYLAGPDSRFGDNVNQSTGTSAADLLATYEADYGEPPSAAYLGHSYDAAALLLDAINASSTVNEAGQLVIEKAAVRTFLTGIRDYDGIIGTINCDDFGDCGSQRLTIISHQNAEDIEASKVNVVFDYAP